VWSTLRILTPWPPLHFVGDLIHELTREFVRAFLRDLRDWTLRHGRVQEAVERKTAAAQAGRLDSTTDPLYNRSVVRQI